MAKRDYYEVLGVDKNASEDEIKKHIEKLLLNITQIRIQVTNLQKRNSKRLLRLMMYCMTHKNVSNTTNLDLMLLAVVEPAVSVVSVAV